MKQRRKLIFVSVFKLKPREAWPLPFLSGYRKNKKGNNNLSLFCLVCKVKGKLGNMYLLTYFDFHLSFSLKKKSFVIISFWCLCIIIWIYLRYFSLLVHVWYLKLTWNLELEVSGISQLICSRWSLTEAVQWQTNQMLLDKNEQNWQEVGF